MMMERIIKVHDDIITVPEAIRKLREDYQSVGYDVSEVIFNMFYVYLDDGQVMICWKDNGFYEVIED